MKYFVFSALLLIGTASLISCDKNGAGAQPLVPATLGVHLQGGFESDWVVVSINDVGAFQDTISTFNVLGVASVFEAKLSTGEHSITVQMNEALAQTESFPLTDSLFIGISYNMDMEVFDFVYSDEAFIYD